MKDAFRRVRLWQIRATDNAILFSTFPPGQKNARQVWVPRSAIDHVSRGAPDSHGVTECIADVAEWLAEKENL